ncbi:hypothetical protein LIER_33061 [Lithospermum erythrorhizon]|uniref:Reverse transcriptase domain-containing protein n=1 Tax=Lithospermum erythrorhizon TaxID=34254 RepID=A0AAV3RVL8_LITER
MCMDFTNLNKVCPKDYYPLPCLGRLVDGSADYKVFDFLDASRGYHQILLEEENQEKMTFITEYGLYCWKVMPFGLKNAGAKDEYEAMVTGLLLAQSLSITRMVVRGDSKLVIEQIRDDCAGKSESLQKYYAKTTSLTTRTTPSNATGETLYSLVFGTEVVLLVEVCLSNISQISFDEEKNEERMRECLDFIEKLRDRALYRKERYEHMIARFYNPRKYYV